MALEELHQLELHRNIYIWLQQFPRTFSGDSLPWSLMWKSISIKPSKVFPLLNISIHIYILTTKANLIWSSRADATMVGDSHKGYNKLKVPTGMQEGYSDLGVYTQIGEHSYICRSLVSLIANPSRVCSWKKVSRPGWIFPIEHYCFSPETDIALITSLSLLKNDLSHMHGHLPSNLCK